MTANTPEELRVILQQVVPGKGARVPYDAFETIFPPGVEHDGSKAAAYKLAQEMGLKIQNRPDDSAVYFYRDPPPDAPTTAG